MLTPDERRTLVLAPFPQTHIAYRGHVWAGVHVTDNFHADVSSGANGNSTETSRHYLPTAALNWARTLKNNEYDGIYRDAVNISMADAQALFGDTE